MAQKKKLSRQFGFRLDDETAEIWEQKVAASGMKASEFFRIAVIENKSNVVTRKSSLNATDVQAILFLLNKQSNNINQIAKAINTDRISGVVSDMTYKKLLAQLEDLNSASTRILGEIL